MDFLVRKRSPPTGVSTWFITPTTLRIQPPIHRHWPHTSPSMFVVHCVASVHVLMIGVESKTVVPLTWFPPQTNLALKRQKPLTNALDGLYLPCADRMLRVRWIEGRVDTLRWHSSVWGESRRGLSFAHDGVGFHPTGRWRYIGCLYQGGQSSIPYPLLSGSLTMVRFTCLSEYD